MPLPPGASDSPALELSRPAANARALDFECRSLSHRRARLCSRERLRKEPSVPAPPPTARRWGEGPLIGRALRVGSCLTCFLQEQNLAQRGKINYVLCVGRNLLGELALEPLRPVRRPKTRVGHI